MSRKDEYAGPLAELLERYLANGMAEDLESYLASNSHLPGPRGNLELAYAFGELAAELAHRRPKEAWALAVALSRLSPEQAPVNDPKEIVPFCGAIAIGGIGAVRSERFSDAIDRLRELARDPRWRTREGVAMGLQRLLARDSERAIKELRRWITGEDWLAMRAVAAGVAEPPLLADEGTALGALQLHELIVDRVLAAGHRSSDEFRSLRQGLGYSLSVVVSALPAEGFRYLRRLAPLDDKDVRWIVRENLKKKRLAGRFPDEVNELNGLLA
jgi:hypothetical protein